MCKIKIFDDISVKPFHGLLIVMYGHEMRSLAYNIYESIRQPLKNFGFELAVKLAVGILCVDRMLRLCSPELPWLRTAQEQVLSTLL